MKKFYPPIKGNEVQDVEILDDCTEVVIDDPVIENVEETGKIKRRRGRPRKAVKFVDEAVKETAAKEVVTSLENQKKNSETACKIWFTRYVSNDEPIHSVHVLCDRICIPQQGWGLF